MTKPAPTTVHLRRSQRVGRVGQPNEQQGVALLTVLLLVVAITVVAGAMLASQKISIRQYELLQTQNQIINDIRAAEQMAAALIRADAQVNETDSLQDVWAQPIAPTELSAHQVTLSIKDASSQFNINNLYHDGQVDDQALAVFQRLLVQQDLDAELADAVLDWQGINLESSAQENDASNSSAQPNSDMSGSNQMQAQSGATNNPPLLTIDQLTSVKGFTPDIVNQLKPYITAVPYYQPINLNTAQPEVLSALVEGLSVEQVSGFANERKTNPGQDVEMLLSEPPWAGLSDEQKQALISLVDVRSHSFQVLIDIAVTDLNRASGDDAATKHRYATTFISKLDPSSALNEQLAQAGLENISTQNSNAMSSGEGESNQFKIAPFGTRLWTYRPAF